MGEKWTWGNDMDLLEEEELLAQLPPREPPPRSQIDFSSTAVEAYVREQLEVQPEIPDAEEALAPVLEALVRRRVQPPVSIADVAAVLRDDLSAAVVAQLFAAFPPFLPRCMKALRGPEFKLVPAELLAEAAARERLVSTLAKGWGHCDVPPYATAYRLLVSCGLPPELLPPYKTLPPGMRGRVVDAWAAAAAHFGWKACQPRSDVRAQKLQATRLHKMSLEL